MSDEIGIGAIKKDYRGMHVPVLASIAVPLPQTEKWNKHAPKSEEERRAPGRSDEILMEYIHRWEDNLKQADGSLAKVVELPGAHHYVFLDEEVKVLQEIQSFLQTLPASN